MSRPRILVIDDDPKFLHFVTELLTGAGYDVRGSSEPLAATGLAEEFGPALVILDISMPGKDGLQIAQELAGVPVMFLTARKATGTLGDARESGAVAYLEKPVQSSKLLWMIKALLEKGGKTGG